MESDISLGSRIRRSSCSTPVSASTWIPQTVLPVRKNTTDIRIYIRPLPTMGIISISPATMASAPKYLNPKHFRAIRLTRKTRIAKVPCTFR